MDHESLRTASAYLNNLLLARGLLRNGNAVDFVKPSKESRAQIINLVHDLILREDRDREQREHVATTLRTLRAEDNRKNHEIERLTTKNEEAARALVQAQAAERATQSEVKKVEKAIKSLQDQAAKLKTTLAQVRTQCTNDVRKRDFEITRLKTHLQGQQRGNKVGMAAPSITISGGVRRPNPDTSRHNLDDPEYSLKQETTEFLTQLSQSLSDENDNLIILIRGALDTMKELLGQPADRKHPDSAIGSTGSLENGKSEHGLLHPLPTSYDTLAADLEASLNQLKTILTNPGFASIEEVEVRDEEIVRLREGWERMEHRWKEVLVMMDGWRRKMDTGHTINIDDLRKGMGLVSPEHMKLDARQRAESPEQSFVGDEVSEIKLPDSEPDSSLILDPPRLAKTGRSSPKRKRDIMEPPEFFDLRPSSQKQASVPTKEEDLDAELVDEAEVEYSEEDNIPSMTIAEKLELARAEAEEAAAAKSRSKARSSRLPVSSTNGQPKGFVAAMALDGAGESELDDTLGKMMPSPMAKKTKIRGRPKRRKSTLSPEELEALLVESEVM